MTIGEMNYDWSQGGNPDFIVSKDLFILLWRHLHLKCSIFRSWSPLLDSAGNFSSPKSNTFKIKMCSSRKYPYPPPPTEGNANSEGRRGPKWGNFRGGGGGLSRSFIRGLGVRLVSYLKLIVVLLRTLSVTLLFIGVSKQKLLFSSMILYLRPAECFFHGLHDSLCNTIVVRSLINLVIYLLLCYTIYCGIHLPRIQTSLSPFRFISSRWPLPCWKLSAWGRGWIFTTLWSCSNKPSSNILHVFNWKEVIEVHCFERWHHLCRVRPYRLHWPKWLTVKLITKKNLYKRKLRLFDTLLK